MNERKRQRSNCRENIQEIRGKQKTTLRVLGTILAVFLALAGYGVYLEYRDRTIWAAAVFVILYVYVFGNYIVNLINYYKTGKAATDKLREILDSKSYDIVKFSEIVDFDNLNIKLNNVTALLDTVNGTYYFG